MIRASSLLMAGAALGFAWAVPAYARGHQWTLMFSCLVAAACCAVGSVALWPMRPSRVLRREP